MSITEALAGGAINLDTFQRETNLRTSLTRDPRGLHSGGNPILSLITIAASAFIFLTIVSWFAVLQAFLDVKIVNGEANNSAWSRLYFAILTTMITVLALGLFLVVYRRLHH